MQKKDIRVGETYAYKVHKHARAIKVEVIDFDARVQQGWGRSTVAGITVRNTEHDKTFACTGRQLHHTWAEEEAIQKRAAEAAKHRRDQANEIAARRASMAAQIDGILAAHGEDVHVRGVHDRVHRAALAAVGFEMVKGLYDTSSEQTSVRARFEVSDFMQTGKVNEKILRVLLADSKVVGA